ncbi:MULTISPECIES: aldose 1-epimerase [Flavobacteriaceae]|uniref:aldose epimerase family protein n=1 Tax=Flavobacteriaceae TaxID=49546 RepID=UPI0010AE8B5A|nr:MULTISPECIES: aldose 1-epimerase [Flavobacteriaceae]NJB37320.1 aldose 1-epimerase [Croceivirga sp. JEA036]TKD61825.1 aldose 1-epimerase [Flavobacterium sp. ASW18X]
MTTLTLGTQSVQIDKGELVSYKVSEHEFMHQKGSPGWGSTDTEMFPIIGPVNEARFMVQVNKGQAIQDQHGLLRQFPYQLQEANATKAVFVKEYKAMTPIENSKYPEKSNRKFLVWPYDFKFTKTIELTEEGVLISFLVEGDKDMPYMLGYHPAFNIHTTDPRIIAGDTTITLDEVLAVGSRALEVPNCSSITLKDAKELTITTTGFGNFMCWTEVRNMVCIEPISFYPYAVPQSQLHEGFEHLHAPVNFSVKLTPSS